MRCKQLTASFLVGGLFALFAAGRVSAEFSTNVSVPKCPKYESLMKSAAQSLRAGDRAAAIAKLHQAKAALDACESKLSSARLLG